jgi:HPt (histidine-containing phosphotransfer) domain-containing protein
VRAAASLGVALPSEAIVDRVDRAVLLASLDGDELLLRSVIAAFVEDTPALLGAARAAVAEGDGASLEHAAHTLKSSVALFGAAKTTGAAQALEDLGRCERTLSAATSAEAARALGHLEAGVAEMLRALPSFIAGDAA